MGILEDGIRKSWGSATISENSRGCDSVFVTDIGTKKFNLLTYVQNCK